MAVVFGHTLEGSEILGADGNGVRKGAGAWPSWKNCKDRAREIQGRGRAWQTNTPLTTVADKDAVRSRNPTRGRRADGNADPTPGSPEGERS
jgi:hypothetical protein